MKKILLTSASVFALSCGAQAADIPLKAPPAPAAIVSWTGFYVGVQGGYVGHWGRFTDENGFLLGMAFDDGSLRRVVEHTEGGAFLGGHLGYNWQSGRVVFGLESDISAVRAKRTIDTSDPVFPTSSVTFDVKWLATIRARVGTLISDATLLYLTGGIAFADVRNDAALTSFAVNMIEDRIKTGWTIGGGLEHRINRNWTVRAEGRYTDLGKKSVVCTPPTAGSCTDFTYRADFSNTLLQGLVGLSLKF